MTKSDLINRLYDEIGRENSWYSWSVGILVTVIVLVVGFYSYQQWRFSENGIQRMKKKFKEEFKEEFREEFKEDFRKEFKEDFREEFKEDFKINEMNDVLEKTQEALKRNEKLNKELNKEIVRSINERFETQAMFMENINSVYEGVAVNRLLFVLAIFNEYKGQSKFTRQTMKSAIVYITNGIQLMINDKKVGIDRFNGILKALWPSLISELAKATAENLDKDFISKHQKLIDKYFKMVEDTNKKDKKISN